MRHYLVILTAALITACTGHLYVGKTRFQDGTKLCEAIAYWSKTDYIIGVKTDSVLTVNAGGNRRSVQYVEQDKRIVYLGEQSRDKKIQGEPTSDKTFVCGWVDNLDSLEHFQGNTLTLYMHCRAKVDEFSTAQGYIPAQPSPYTFTVTEETVRSLTGKLPPAPPPATCSSQAQ